MKKNYIKHLLTAVLLLCCSVGFAQKFTVNGIRYNVIDKNKRWVEVAPKEPEYTGNIVVPGSVTRNGVKYQVVRIGESTFEYSSVKSVRILNGVVSIESGAFLGCSSLNSLSLPKTLRNIADNALAVEHGEAAYSSENNLVSIKVEAGNPVYDSRNNCNAIIDKRTNTLIKGCRNTVIPNGVRKIVEDAFSCSDIRSITIPSTVTDIEPNAFCFCTNLKSIKVHPSNPVYDSRNNCNAIIETSTNTLVMGFPTTVIPNTVTRIGDRAFIGSSITHITIPNSVKSLGENVFYECYDLETITLPRHLDFNLEEQGLPDTVRIIWR